MGIVYFIDLNNFLINISLFCLIIITMNHPSVYYRMWNYIENNLNEEHPDFAEFKKKICRKP